MNLFRAYQDLILARLATDDATPLSLVELIDFTSNAGITPRTTRGVINALSQSPYNLVDIDAGVTSIYVRLSKRGRVFMGVSDEQ